MAPPKAPKCPAPGCQTRLNASTKGQCKQCKQEFCKEHSFPSDHDCMRLSGGLSRSASAPQLVPKAAVQPGVLVSASAASKLKADAPQKADPSAAATASAAVKQQLQDAAPAQLLQSLLNTSPTAPLEAQSVLIRALGDDAAELRSAAAAKGQELIAGTGASDAAMLLPVLLGFLEADVGRALPASRCASMPSLAAAAGARPTATADTRQDRVKAGLVPLLPGLSTHLTPENRHALVDRLAAGLSTHSELLYCAIAAALPRVMDTAALTDAEQQALVSSLLQRLDEGRGVAHGLAAVITACGASVLDKWGAFAALTTAMQAKESSPTLKEHSFVACQQLCLQLGAGFEPYMLQLMPVVLASIGDTQVAVREAAEAAANAIATTFAPQGVSLIMPALLLAMGDRAWKKKESSLQLMAILAQRAPRQTGRCLPDAIPKLMECLQDTHPKVAAAAAATLSVVASVISQPEIQKNMGALIDALSKPEQKTAACLEKLMETTFVNSMDSAALAVVVPIVARGLRERSAELKKMAAMTAGNIFALVNEPRDMAPFVPIILPEVIKAVEHSHPDVRRAAERAKGKLLLGTKVEDTQAAVPAAADDAIAQHVRAALASAPAAVQHYTAAVTAQLLDEREVSTAEELMSVIAPMLTCFAATQAVEELAASTIALHEAQLAAAAGHDIHAGKDLIVNISNIILAFAGRVLLNKTPFYLERGHRYGLIGQNGVGKTTLLTRVAAGDINNFPKDVSCYYIQHEILAEAGTSVTTFMLGQVPEGCGRERIVQALEAVGFSEERQAAAVSELSGGWRMKLAIARSMLWDADLLLLDEPTNHLDTAAIEWLVSYINNLKCTVCLVSHDYDFLSEVLTDVIHICDSKLTYYPGTFRDFQAKRPEIAAGLPSPAGAVQRAKEALAAPANGGEAPADGRGSAAGAPQTEAAPNANEPAINSIEPLKFPDPGPLDGIRSRVKTVMKMVGVSFQYETAASPILTDATVRLTLGSRVALVGQNGAGKTTLLKLLVGDLQPTTGVGEVWKHHNLRVAYIAQHSMHHLEEHVESTPLAYIQDRFYLGRDKELAKLASLALDDSEREMMTQRGEIEAILGRAERGKQLWYEVQKVGRKKDDTVWEPLAFLSKMQPYVLKLVKNYDEKMKAMASGVDIRPLTAEEVKRHLDDFGINEDLAVSKIRRMSGGQKSRLVLAAALWNKPHIIALDEPTNYLDNTTLAALTKALQLFKGGVITISHNEAFVHELCTELFHVANGCVVTELIGAKLAKAAEKEAIKARQSASKGEDAE